MKVFGVADSASSALHVLAREELELESDTESDTDTESLLGVLLEFCQKFARWFARVLLARK